MTSAVAPEVAILAVLRVLMSGPSAFFGGRLPAKCPGLGGKRTLNHLA